MSCTLEWSHKKVNSEATKTNAGAEAEIFIKATKSCFLREDEDLATKSTKRKHLETKHGWWVKQLYSETTTVMSKSNFIQSSCACFGSPWPFSFLVLFSSSLLLLLCAFPPSLLERCFIILSYAPWVSEKNSTVITLWASSKHPIQRHIGLTDFSYFFHTPTAKYIHINNNASAWEKCQTNNNTIKNVRKRMFLIH